MEVYDKQNVNPTIYASTVRRRADDVDEYEREAEVEPIDDLEVFEFIRHISDPEHPRTLEQLHVVMIEGVKVDDTTNSGALRIFAEVEILYTPTIPHCSMATLIGLSIRVKLLRALSPRFKVRVRITPGAHNNEKEINKQLNDKERVAAALENDHLLSMVNT